MKKGLVLISSLVTLMGTVQSCNKEVVQEIAPISTMNSATNQLQMIFAQSLSKALVADPEVRNFLKAEGLKMFDKDNDILYQMVKDCSLKGGGTFRDHLLKYIDPNQLNSIETELPLLTIFIPTLPGGFSAETWQADQQIPVVAVRKIGDNTIPLYDGSNKSTVIAAGNIPGFPVLVIKQNERVRVGDDPFKTAEQTIKPFYKNQQFSFSFTDPIYDGSTDQYNASVISRIGGSHSGSNNRLAYSSYETSISKSISVRNIGAYEIDKANPGYQWQRDYVYYGITPTKPKGPLRTNFRESVRMFKLSNAGIAQMSGYSGDPNSPTVGSSNFNNANYWLDGMYEFSISVLTNPKDGSPGQRVYRFPASPSDLYDMTYVKKPMYFGTTYYQLASVTPKEFYPNISVGCWDLANYGTAWTYHIFEENQTIERTETESVTTTYAGNFEFDLTFNATIKGGAKFGASATQQSTKTVESRYTVGSTDLGMQVANFYDPIITGNNNDMNFTGFTGYYTYELAPGGTNSYVFLSVEPYSSVESENTVR